MPRSAARFRSITTRSSGRARDVTARDVHDGGVLIDQIDSLRRVLIELVQIRTRQGVLDAAASRSTASLEHRAAGALDGDDGFSPVRLDQRPRHRHEVGLRVRAIADRHQPREDDALIRLATARPKAVIASVSDTPGILSRRSRAMRSSSDCVAARLDPTGRRANTWNRDSSSSGTKFSPDALNSGYVESDDDRARDHDRPAVGHRPLEQPRVGAIDVAVEAPARHFVVLVVLLHADPARREHRRQRERDEQADRDRRRRGQAERRHEAADDAAHEADREEHGEQRQRRRHDGEADLARALDRRLERRHSLLFDEPVDVLEHDDRVVDDDADHQRQREHRHLVEREAERGHQRERADDRRRNRDAPR